MSDPHIAVILSEWESATPDSQPQLAEASIGGGAEVRVLVQCLAQAGMLEIVELKHGLSIESSSFVGQVEVGNLTVTVLPKLKSQSLLNLLRYAYGLNNLTRFSETFHTLDFGAFQDLLISQLIAEVQELISGGLHRAYVRREDDLESPRGRIAIQRVVAQWGRLSASLPCIHHPRTQDCFLNRVVLAGLALAATLATDTSLKREARRLGGSLATLISPVEIDIRAIEHAEQLLNRLTTAYVPAISILRLLAESKGITLAGDTASVPLPGFLFDMNRFFQALLSRFLRENLTDCSLRDEYRLRDVIRFVPGYNPRQRRSPTPRPDFVLVQGSTIAGILDAKYRDLWEKPLPREMLYQLGIYAVVHDLRVATILYPCLDPYAKEARLSLHDSLRGQAAAQVHLRPVQLELLEGLVISGDSIVARRKRRAYAERLAFGERIVRSRTATAG